LLTKPTAIIADIFEHEIVKKVLPKVCSFGGMSNNKQYSKCKILINFDFEN
jgi:hypothetical protein